ncbi:MAG: RNA 2',3'-cyclic phosphodiesterase [Gallionella sp.]
MSHQTDRSCIKVFFALWPTASERSHLAAWQKPLKSLCGGRAMRGETLHNTLVFIGNIVQSRLEPLQLAAQEVSGERFELCFDAARYWGHNHIVYAAPVHQPKPLSQLVLGLEQNLARHGFMFDIREYRPHVTLIRNAHWTDEPLPAMQPVCWQLNDFALVQSVSHERLAGYRVLARFPLGLESGDPHRGPG